MYGSTNGFDRYQKHGLIDIKNMLQSMGKDIRSFPLLGINEEFDTANGVAREIFEESSIQIDHEHTTLSDSLNTEQRAIYDEILDTGNNEDGRIFFVDGPGGT